MKKIDKKNDPNNQENLLLFALEETNDGWWKWDVKENRFYLSPRYWTTFGYDPSTKNNLAEEWQEICHPEDLENVQKILKEHFESRGEIPYITEVRFKHRNGHWVTVICRGKTIKWDMNWNPIQFVGVHTDITDRKNHESELKVSREKYEAILKNLPVGFARYELNSNNEFIFTEANQKFDEFLNVDHSGFSGKTMLELFPFLKSTPLYQKFLSIAHGGESLHDPESISEEFGKRKVFDSHTFSATLNDICFLFNDMTELYEIKERYNLAIQGVGVGVWEWFDVGKKEIFWSNKLLDLLGYLPDELEVTIDVFKNLLHPDDLKKTWDAIHAHFSKKERYDTEFRLKCKDGTYKWFRGTGQATYDKDNKPQRMVGSLEDIQQKKDSVASLVEQTKVAQRNAKLASIGQLAAGVGHEINNPLSIIKGYTSSLIQILKNNNGLQKNNLISTLAKIDVASNRISKITEGLRSFARNDDENLCDFSIIDVLKESCDLVGEIYEKEGINLQLNLNNFENKINAFGNRGKFQQLLMNLLSNARDALVGVSIKKINVSYKEFLNHVQIGVSDTGHGISEDIKDKIFDPFFTTKQVNEGTGIGLSFVHKFVEELNGSITFKSKVNDGTSFEINVPLQKNNKKTSSYSNLAMKEINEDLKNKRLKIIIAEDEFQIREILEDVLVRLGHKVFSVENGKLALETYLIQPNMYDMIISDMQMPEMDGPTLLKKLRSIKNIPQPLFVFFTGGIYNNFESKDSELFGLFDAYFLKPFEAKDIENAILKCLDKKRKK